jgi:hypothetical protein
MKNSLHEAGSAAFGESKKAFFIKRVDQWEELMEKAEDALEKELKQAHRWLEKVKTETEKKHILAVKRERQARLRAVTQAIERAGSLVAELEKKRR